MPSFGFLPDIPSSTSVVPDSQPTFRWDSPAISAGGSVSDSGSPGPHRALLPFSSRRSKRSRVSEGDDHFSEHVSQRRRSVSVFSETGSAAGAVAAFNNKFSWSAPGADVSTILEEDEPIADPGFSAPTFDPVPPPALHQINLQPQSATDVVNYNINGLGIHAEQSYRSLRAIGEASLRAGLDISTALVSHSAQVYDALGEGGAMYRSFSHLQDGEELRHAELSHSLDTIKASVTLLDANLGEALSTMGTAMKSMNAKLRSIRDQPMSGVEPSSARTAAAPSSDLEARVSSIQTAVIQIKSSLASIQARLPTHPGTTPVVPSRPVTPSRPTTPRVSFEDRLGPASTTSPPERQPPPLKYLLPHQIANELDSGIGSRNRITNLRRELARVKALPKEVLEAEATHRRTLAGEKMKSFSTLGKQPDIFDPRNWFPTQGWRPAKAYSKGKDPVSRATTPAPSATAATSVAAPVLPQKPAPLIVRGNGSQVYLLRFSATAQVAREDRMSETRMWEAVHQLDQTVYPLNVLSVRFSVNNNFLIVLTFSATTPEVNIMAHRTNILKALGHGRDPKELTFEPFCPINKVFLSQVPYRNSQDLPHSPTSLLNQVNAAIPGITWLDPPRFVKTDASNPLDTAELAAVLLHFKDDAENTTLSRILAGRPYFLFGRQVTCSSGGPVVHVTQCSRCWAMGEVHIDCQVRCKICADPHRSEDHSKSCESCILVGAEPGAVCSHWKCALCGSSAHFADAPNCPHRNQWIAQQQQRQSGPKRAGRK